MFWLLSRPVVWPAKAGYRTGRLVGYRRLTVLLLGVAIGLLVAPTTGAELRARVRARLLPEPPVLPPDAPIDLTTNW